ncbi:MAG TPA: T9SS type A sorting domain-containing protein, partial [Leeuwenhoekiella sp.]|nr:T9SS type A sorting domain-containing protein [Leeuwenhoekiella sp.]
KPILQILPDGPLRNDPFSIEAVPNELWAVYGDYSNSFNPYPLKRRGLSHFQQETGWNNISYPEALNANNMVNITINPENTEQVFISSFNSGLLEINEEIPTQLFDETNSGLSDLPVNPTDVRINGAAFDPNGNLWVTNTLVENALARKSGNDITGFSIKEIIPDFDEVIYTELVTDRQGNVYFGSNSMGLLAYNPRIDMFVKIAGEEEANLPSDDIRTLALDNSGTLWIGTTAGLRLLYGPAQVFENPEIQTNAIVILENDIPVELLNEQSIQSIAVDGSNNKWVGTLSNGVFYFSSNGQETLLQFNTSNSPLPSNTINSISIDNESGEVYFATPQGLVSYSGSAVAAAENLKAVRAFPNPVRPQYTGPVTIDGLTERANVKITDITGNLVYEEVSEGGSIQWDTTAFGRHKVASGVYMILVTSSDASETKVAKIMIIR